ncbi:MAG: oligopeptide transporter, OPT family [Acidobacteria bacterium]|nr:oligopeptide transporter, OPT family [Acidobacteriota bacterium]
MRASESPAEFTAKAVVLGILFGLIFGASTVYLGLRAGLTVSASIPIAVLAISVLKRLGGSTILENNIVQTIGSAGESLAAGVVFTIPALIFLVPYGPAYFNYVQITLLAIAGGILGVLMMVPLRRALIEKEHGVLPYPEGTACADVLVAGERGGALARTVFMGLGTGAIWKSLSWIFQIFPTAIGYTVARTGVFPNATLNLDLSPEYMGVGYVIGPRIAGVMFAGGVLSWLVLLPLLSIMGNYMTVPFPPVPASGLRINQMSAGQLWSAYIRYTGAGAVLAAGLITLARTLPTIVSSFRESVKEFGAATGAAGRLRTDRDMPLTVVLVGSLLLALFLAVTPGMPMQWNFVAAVLIVVFGFFFVTVSSRITGLIGNSSNPISGMTIATLIMTCSSRGWMARRRLCADRARRGRRGLHRRLNRRRDLAGPENRLSGGCDADQAANRPRHRRSSRIVRHWHDDAVSAPHHGDRVTLAARPAGDPDGDDHQRTPQSEPPVGAGARRRVHLRHAGTVRHSVALVRGRVLPADCDDGSDFCRWNRAMARRA